MSFRQIVRSASDRLLGALETATTVDHPSNGGITGEGDPQSGTDTDGSDEESSRPRKDL